MIFDLTHPITTKTPVYPGDPPVIMEPAGQLAQDGFNDHKVTFGTHVGTHIDAPIHMIEGGKALKDYVPERFMLQAICIDATSGFDVKIINDTDIKPGMAVLFYTGASDYFNQEKYWHDYQVLNEACCELLIDKQILMVGVDTGSVDIKEGFPVHKSLLGADILIIENLTNLKALAGKAFELIALPLKLEQDGAPARVIARTAQ